MSGPTLDLSQLALERPSGGAPSKKSPPRRLLTRFVLPLAILLGFFSLLAVAAGSRLLPQRSVEVLPVIVKRAAVQQAGTPLFQAPGWVEPRPMAISVAALAPGVIEELLVVEGQHVSKDEPIARLITIDAEFAVRQAETTLALRNGELQRAEAERRAAKVRLEKPVHLQVQLAGAKSTLANAKTELSKVPFLVDAAEANSKFTLRSLEGKQAAQAAVSGRVLQQAESEYATADATLRELRSRGPHLQREVDALQAQVDALQTQLSLLVDENRQLQEAEAKVMSAVAVRDEAELQLQQAELALARNVIRAPISGRILSLVAAPGTRVMGLGATAGQSSSTVVEMYDPARLQVRADVRLEDVPLVQPGQPVEIETASSKDKIQGRVLHATSTADIQKNTLEVKVELIDPPSTVSPQMLVTATFIAPASTADASTEPTEAERLFVPKQLVQTGESGSFVWIVDADQRAQRRPVSLGEATDASLIEVHAGLNVTDKLIASGVEGLDPASPVHITGEDGSIGIK